ncbi:MAG: DUF3127 domain-containing protein [Candidatus Cryptobacteroides sp.]|nr:DUF3127 domain-containing protein [Bacteroidales bacterium]MDY3964191.1 DUF3127 domain-containing protein [Candidatus Cryptobacteroides sp.]
MEIEGRLIQKLGIQSGKSARGDWAKQEFVIEFQEGNFPSKACFSVWGADKVKDLEKYQPGDQIKVAFNVSSREFNGKWYTDLRAWRISPAGAQAPASGYGAPAYGQNTAGTAPASGYQDVPAGFAPSYGAGPQQVPPHSIEDMPEDDLPF